MNPYNYEAGPYGEYGEWGQEAEVTRDRRGAVRSSRFSRPPQVVRRTASFRPSRFRPGFSRFRFSGRTPFQRQFRFGGRPFGYRRWYWLRRFGGPFVQPFGGTFDNMGFDPNAGIGDGGNGADTTPSQWVQWAQACLAQLIGAWVPQDGLMGPATQRAVQMFQMQQQLPPTGALDDSTVGALRTACSAQTGATTGQDPNAAQPGT